MTQRTDTSDRRDGIRDIQHRLSDIVTGAAAPPVDVTTYLLEPPVAAAQLARAQRRRQWVRWGSIASALLISIVLLVPAPSGSTSGEGAAPAVMPQTTPATSAEAEITAPVRVDRVPPRRASQRAATAPRATRARRVATRPVPRAATHAGARPVQRPAAASASVQEPVRVDVPAPPPATSATTAPATQLATGVALVPVT